MLRMPNGIIKIAESLYVHDDITKLADEITKKMTDEIWKWLSHYSKNEVSECADEITKNGWQKLKNIWVIVAKWLSHNGARIKSQK
jgi:hypothetical protein